MRYIKFVVDILKDNDYPLEMIFHYINKRIKSLTCKKSAIVNNISSDYVDTDGVLKEIIIVFPYIRPISNKIIKSVNKSKNTISYRCLNKLNKFIKIKTKSNMIKIIMSYLK